MITARNLTKIYNGFAAVENFECSLKYPSITGLLGANGAGKTTIMRMLSGFLAPSSGSISIGEYDLTLNSIDARSLIGYLPEIPALYDEMTVERFLQYMAVLKNFPFSQKKREAILDQCALNDVAKKRISKLSRGFRQRVGLAQALVADPPILIIDEPTSALDPLQIKETRELLKKLGQTKTILISTHILTEVEQICQEVIILRKGKIALQKSMADIKQAYEIHLEVEANQQKLHRELQEFFPESLLTTTGKIIIKTQQSKEIQRQIGKMCHKGNYTILSLCGKSVNLEDIYLKCTRQEKTI